MTREDLAPNPERGNMSKEKVSYKERYNTDEEFRIQELDRAHQWKRRKEVKQAASDVREWATGLMSAIDDLDRAVDRLDRKRRSPGKRRVR